MFDPNGPGARPGTAVPVPGLAANGACGPLGTFLGTRGHTDHLRAPARARAPTSRATATGPRPGRAPQLPVPAPPGPLTPLPVLYIMLKCVIRNRIADRWWRDGL